MKTSAWRGIFVAASLAVAAGSASAQTYTAEVPVAFRAGGASLAPGSYEIRTSSNQAFGAVYLYSQTDKSAAVILPVGQADAPKAWLERGDPKVTFECLDGKCRLASLWHGTGTYVQKFSTTRAPGDNIARRPEIVTLTMIKVR